MKNGPHLRPLVLPGLLGAWLGLCAIGPGSRPSAGTPPPPSALPPGRPAPRTAVPATHPRADQRPPLELATEARSDEELGAYDRAAQALLALRGRVPADADLELALAMDQARTGDPDSAATRLWSPTLTAALDDTLPVGRRHRYPWKRETLWINGRFDGWAWYVARARAEVAAARARWGEALEAARRCTEERPSSGTEWLVRAVAAGRAGQAEEAADAARRAAELDPSLPEAQYLLGLWEWRAGRRMSAQARFRAAVELDSSYREPALALVRVQLPAWRPDSLPAAYLTGVRRSDLLTSPLQPKIEEFAQMDQQAFLTHQVDPAVPDSLQGRFAEVQLPLAVLIDERGRVVMHDLPWLTPGALPEPLIGRMAQALTEWRFRPASKLGAPHRVWAMVMVTIRPQ